MKWNASLNMRNANRYVLIKLFSGTAFQYRSYQKFRLVKKMRNEMIYTLHYTTLHYTCFSCTVFFTHFLFIEHVKTCYIAKHTIINLSIIQTKSNFSMVGNNRTLRRRVLFCFCRLFLSSFAGHPSVSTFEKHISFREVSHYDVKSSSHLYGSRKKKVSNGGDRMDDKWSISGPKRDFWKKKNTICRFSISPLSFKQKKFLTFVPL